MCLVKVLCVQSLEHLIGRVVSALASQAEVGGLKLAGGVPAVELGTQLLLKLGLEKQSCMTLTISSLPLCVLSGKGNYGS